MTTPTTSATSPTTTTTATTATLTKEALGCVDRSGCEGEFAHNKGPARVQCANAHGETLKGAVLAKGLVVFNKLRNCTWLVGVLHHLDHKPVQVFSQGNSVLVVNGF
jgi:hypothetical protein